MGRRRGFFTRISEQFSCAAASPHAFVLALLLVAVWLACGPYFDWSEAHQIFVNTATTVITYLMVFLLQNSQVRGDKAMQVKLDELILATKDARNAVIGIEESDDPKQEHTVEE